MLNINIFQFFSFSFLFISINAFSIIFPFKTIALNKNITSNEELYNISHFVNDHYSMPAYISIKIGSPSQEIKFILTNEDCGFKIGQAKKCIKDKNYLSYYNRNLSSQFNFTENYTKRISEFQKGHSCSDRMEFSTDLSDINNKIFFNDVGFYLGTDTTEEICGILGLELNSYKMYCDDINNIFESLKYNGIIQKQDWIIKYTNKYEGVFIISPDITKIIKNYDENKLFVTYTDKRVSGNSWNLIIDNVYSAGFNKTINKKKIRAEINNDIDLIEGDWDYYYHITLTYFKPYIKKSICKLEEITVGVYHYFAIECDKNKFNLNDMKQFPTLSLELVCFNTIFNFDYKDLFTEIEHKYFFNVIFNKFIDRWIFGKPVLRKYPLLIDNEAQTIGYYNENWEILEEKNLEKNNYNKLYFYLVIFLVIILFVIIGVIFYFVGKNKNAKKKRRANELLDDNFEYTPKKNDENDNFEKNTNIIND